MFAHQYDKTLKMKLIRDLAPTSQNFEILGNIRPFSALYPQFFSKFDEKIITFFQKIWEHLSKKTIVYHWFKNLNVERKTSKNSDNNNKNNELWI